MPSTQLEKEVPRGYWYSSSKVQITVSHLSGVRPLSQHWWLSFNQTMVEFQWNWFLLIKNMFWSYSPQWIINQQEKTVLTLNMLNCSHLVSYLGLCPTEEWIHNRPTLHVAYPILSKPCSVDALATKGARACISRNGIDRINRNIPSLATQRTIKKLSDFILGQFTIGIF